MSAIGEVRRGFSRPVSRFGLPYPTVSAVIGGGARRPRKKRSVKPKPAKRSTRKVGKRVVKRSTKRRGSRSTRRKR